MLQEDLARLNGGELVGECHRLRSAVHHALFCRQKQHACIGRTCQLALSIAVISGGTTQSTSAAHLRLDEIFDRRLLLLCAHLGKLFAQLARRPSLATALLVHDELILPPEPT